MMFVLLIVVSALVIAYFVGIALVLVFAMFDKQKDTTMDNRIVAFLLLIGLIIVPLLGVLTSLPGR